MLLIEDQGLIFGIFHLHYLHFQLNRMMKLSLHLAYGLIVASYRASSNSCLKFLSQSCPNCKGRYEFEFEL